jgi:hypothetical protein
LRWPIFLIGFGIAGFSGYCLTNLQFTMDLDSSDNVPVNPKITQLMLLKTYYNFTVLPSLNNQLKIDMFWGVY